MLKRKDATPKGMQHKEFGFKADVKEDGKFSGYGSVFGNTDSYGEIVAPGAFAASLAAIKQAKRILPALWQHRSGEPIGGFDTMSEDSYGLKVEGFLVLEDPTAKRAHVMMKAGIITGMSIGYYVRKSSYDEKTGIRTLLELDLVEISVVTFPANEAAQISDVKSTVESGKLPTLPEFEKFLREAGGFSKTQAAAIAGKGLRPLLRSESDDEKEDAQVIELLENFKLNF